jgi:hypothetical protein
LMREITRLIYQAFQSKCQSATAAASEPQCMH